MDVTTDLGQLEIALDLPQVGQARPAWSKGYLTTARL
jgi:hypothetical protein